MSTRRVVVTGLGTLTPLANDFPTTWSRLLQGASGIGPVTAFDATGYDCRFAGEVRNFDPVKAFKNPKDVRRTDRYTHLAMGAAAEAWRDAGLEGATLDADRAGVLVGSGIGGLSTLEEQHTILRDRGPKKVSPFMIPMMINNIAAGHISMHFGLRDRHLKWRLRVPHRARLRRRPQHPRGATHHSPRSWSKKGLSFYDSDDDQ